MDKILIEGGARLQGKVRISGAKNAALPIMTAALLADGKSVFRNVPDLKDLDTLGDLLRYMGSDVQRDGPAHVVEIDSSGLDKWDAPYEHVKKMRASVLVLGSLLARFGKAKVSLPGGCAIGARPIDQHLKGLEAMGADITLEGGYVFAEAKGGLRGAEIVFDITTVGGTENILMAASIARGRSHIVGAAREPEVEELARVLNKMGANINGAGTDIIVVEGVDALHPVDHAIIPDRIETGTYMAAVAVTGGDVVLEGCYLELCEAVVAKLKEAGIWIEGTQDGVHVKSQGRIDATDMRTSPYPGFPTDMQAQFMALMTVARGRSMIEETVFENRFMHASELQRMGADIEIRGATAVVEGVERLHGAQVMATDLRASASLVIAALAAEGTTEIHRIYHLDRGYEHIEEKLSRLGAAIRRVPGGL
ncbi:MAG: UDP-N-acetylglucosamine 1-carboxyvinyltransferase [Pseudomonadota bacterium]